MKYIYDEDYFENGIVAGKSCYVNYHWMPELTIKMAHNIIKYLRLKEGTKVLDYGCAKGFLVKALRILDIDAFGCDISNYAIDKIDPEVRNFCKLMKRETLIPFRNKFDWLISKDVLEHLKEDKLNMLLDTAHKFTNNMFHIVPLSNGQDKYVIPEYELDPSHVLRKNHNWWKEKFESRGWRVSDFNYRVKGIKDNWTSKYKKGNAFFVLAKK